ncbi:MAG TPA: diguanylate cyclase [Anaerolineaceae bacterium]|nr:diguanylate cyclase [Anaerolineaceae bacterium]HPN51182.1 diguanylate cyclase [Anaerolineaceae bacterium]
MSLTYLIYFYPIWFSALISAIMAVYAWRRREVAGAQVFAVFLLDVAAWSVLTGLLELSRSPEIALIFYKLRYIGIATVPVLLLIFCLQFFQRQQRFPLWAILLLFAFPIATEVVIWCRFDWFVEQVTFKVVDGLTLIKQDTVAPWFLVHMLYSQVVSFSVLILLGFEILRASHIYRWQAVALLASAIPPIVVAAFMATFVNPSFAHLVPVTFFLTGIITGWALFRYRLLDLVPAAQDMLIGLMSDGLLVFDSRRRIVEINPAAEALLDLSAARAIGKTPAQLPTPADSLLERFLALPDGRSETSIGAGEALRHLDVRLTTIQDARGQASGRLLVLRDITDLTNAMQRLENQLFEIQALQEELKEQTIRDPLTNLFNRRYLDETVERELARAQREKYPVSMAMIDIDHFKHTNDTYGHPAGDIVLQTLADFLARHTRQVDMVCRMGGEEFLVVLPNASRKFTRQRAEEWRQAIQDTAISLQNAQIHITVSIGIASYPQDGASAQSVISAADAALYLAKSGGRNRVELSPEKPPVPQSQDHPG